MASADGKVYDTIFIGTSMICMLEAIYQSRIGKSVLMVDVQPEIGGAWRPLNLFGVKGIENAIHYFLPDPNGFKFMKQVLGWRVVEATAKFRVFDPPVFGIRRVGYHSGWAPFLIESSRKRPWKNRIRALGKGLTSTLRGKEIRSHYVEGGCLEMLEKVKMLVRDSTVEVRMSTLVSEIQMGGSQTDLVRVTAEGGEGPGVIWAKTLNVTHGTNLNSIASLDGSHTIQQKKHLRPAMHLCVTDSEESGILEVIFTDDDLIKYAHDVTRYSSDAAQLNSLSRKVIVLALHPHIKNIPGLEELVVAKLQRAGLLTKAAVVEGRFWWDIYLPGLEDEDLEIMKKKFGDKISYLKTENFARGIGLYADRWSTVMKAEIGSGRS